MPRAKHPPKRPSRTPRRRAPDDQSDHLLESAKVRFEHMRADSNEPAQLILESTKFRGNSYSKARMRP